MAGRLVMRGSKTVFDDVRFRTWMKSMLSSMFLRLFGKDVLENNGVKNMEQYRELMGEFNGLNLMRQELSDMLEKQEKLHD